MTSNSPAVNVARVSVLLATLAVFLSLWLTMAVHPWNGPSAAPAVIPATPAAAQPASTAVLQTSPVTPAVQPIAHLDD